MDDAIQKQRRSYDDIVADNDTLLRERYKYLTHKCFGFCGVCRENLEQMELYRTRLSEAEAENERIKQNRDHWRLSSKQESASATEWHAKFKDADRKREEAERATKALAHAFQGFRRHHEYTGRANGITDEHNSKCAARAYLECQRITDEVLGNNVAVQANQAPKEKS